MDAGKRKKIIGITLAIIVVIITSFIMYNIFIAKKTGTSIFIPTLSGGSEESLPPVPDLQMKYSIFDTIMKMFGSDASTIGGLPVDAGTMGNKANPFERNESEPFPTPSPNPNGSPSPIDIGQGTK